MGMNASNNTTDVTFVSNLVSRARGACVVTKERGTGTYTTSKK